jgi:EAL domain-containing protein (putative c-di-GMP-specific phosphodiesterase class I)
MSCEGEIPPTTFLPIAEETGLIVPLGEWILKTACSYATTWPADTRLAVNLSPAQFKTQDVYGLVRRGLSETLGTSEQTSAIVSSIVGLG